MLYAIGIPNATEVPIPILWGSEFIQYLLALVVVVGLLFGSKAKARVSEENVPKLKKAINISYIISIALLTIIGLLFNTYTIVQNLLHVVMIAIIITLGLLFINKTLDNTWKIRYLYVDIACVSILAIALIIFFVSEESFVITTGRYGHGTVEDNAIADQIYGPKDTQDRFNTYFNWYNIVHEIGHGAIMANSDLKLDPVDEEQLVNDFAVSFWSYYGEEGMIEYLGEIVEYALDTLDRPVAEGVSHMQFGRDNWGKPEIYTFNNYGWFQYSCVKYSLNNVRPLEEVLAEMGINNIKVQPQKVFTFASIGEEDIPDIIKDVVTELQEWGVEMRPIYHRLSNNPSNHNLFPTRNMFGILGTVHNYVEIKGKN